MKPVDYTLLPEHMRYGMRLYIEQGVPPGSFLRAVLENDFVEAVGKADGINLAALPHFAMFLYHEAPGACWGSPELVDGWLNLFHGLREEAK